MSQNPNSSSRPLQPLPVPSMPIPPSELITEISMGITEEMTQQVATPTKNVPNMPQNGQISAPRPPQNRAPSQAASPQTPPRPGRAPNQPTLEHLLRMAFDRGYSDVHLGVGEKPRMRDRGEMIILNYPEIDINTFYSWLREILGEEEILRFKKDLEFDGATQYEFARVRINIFESLRGPGMVLRLIPMKILTIEQLGLPAVLRNVCDVQKGLILITGPTGSGKTTTLAAMIDYINKEHAKHIITIEDPIEFVHQSRRSLIKQREVGIHTHEFDNALKASLREDPDIILVGEMRDKSTVNTALKAAQTGHLVMGTLHTNSAVKTLERILTLYTAEERESMQVAIAESLVCIISQGLCRTTDSKRTAFHDILVNTETVKDYICSGKNDEILELMKDGEYHGMITTNQSLFNLYQEGRISDEVALEMSPVPNEMAMMLRGRI
ncbi:MULTISPECIES: type IV pilus twitching motility protein PilT [Microcystis]|uniref:PilT/PilU family type 4a pilus ATPase n=2 Tax=Microcystis TaxID=1125 RepID=A0A841UP95_MICAE|nr:MULTISPECIES: type IV pilus twitching motility protein PilT [Microcystis]MBC1190067.1 PilT/PilU family type 4a pilus ATPase [Microcystis aeruginosa BLCC-F108]MCA2591785.1 PilT/PilU family type 4a pilus ATPase [Microcystis sp. M31BS1]MDB9409212.1 type IV pilus twitching motility protein PilT [Microcystis aeruginosa CS-558/01A06]TRT80054.1 MAG: type IV pilus twitching motility protein PilT [Microcystis sp. M_OC_Ca_00000000_S217Cul]TRT83035.1 MAG: type IV pilus twitching motility protein PilT 